MMQPVYSTNTLSDLYALTEAEVQRLVKSEGKICFNQDNKEFLIFIPIFDSFISFDPVKHADLKSKLDKDEFQVIREEIIFKVVSANSFPSSFLMLEDLVEKVEEFIDIDDKASFLVSDRILVPLFFGHRNIIERLASDFDGVNNVYSFKDFIEWRKNNV